MGHEPPVGLDAFVQFAQSPRYGSPLGDHIVRELLDRLKFPFKV